MFESYVILTTAKTKDTHIFYSTLFESYVILTTTKTTVQTSSTNDTFKCC